jgi:hypothetical protein
MIRQRAIYGNTTCNKNGPTGVSSQHTGFLAVIISDSRLGGSIQNNTAPECAAVRTAVNQEMRNHALNVNRPVARISNHRAGNAVDIAWSLPNCKV